MQRAAHTDVAIVGGGLAGLAAARMLLRGGLSVRVIEARDRLGGRAHTLDLVDGGVADTGCSFVHGLHGNPLKPVFEQIGVELTPFVDAARPIYQHGAALEADRALRIFEAASDVFFGSSREANVNAPMPPEGSTLADFAEHAFGDMGEDGDAVRMVLAAKSGWTGADLDDVALRWWGFEQDHSGVDAIVKGGYGQLVRWLRDEIEAGGGLIELGEPVERIAQLGDDEVEIKTQSGLRFTASYAISTLPLGVMQRATHLFDPPLPPRKLESLGKLRMGLLNKVFLQYERAWWPQEDHAVCHVILPASLEPADALLRKIKPSAMSFLASGSRPELCLFVGGSAAAELKMLSDAEASSWAHSLAASSLAADGERATDPIKTHVTRWNADSYSLGSYAYVPASTGASPLDMIELSRAVWSDRLGFAGEATEHNLFASAHGAYVSGEREARRILAVVAGRAAET